MLVSFNTKITKEIIRFYLEMKLSISIEALQKFDICITFLATFINGTKINFQYLK